MKRCAVMMSIALCGLALSALPGALHARQTPGDVRAAVSIAQQRNWYVRVVTTTDGRVEGRFGRDHGAEIRIDRRVLVVDDIRGIERRNKSGGGLLPGAIVGGIVGSIAMGYFMGGKCGAQCVSVWGLVGGTAGALAGGSIGNRVAPPTVEWIRVWP